RLRGPVDAAVRLPVVAGAGRRCRSLLLDGPRRPAGAGRPRLGVRPVHARAAAGGEPPAGALGAERLAVAGGACRALVGEGPPGPRRRSASARAGACEVARDAVEG